MTITSKLKTRKYEGELFIVLYLKDLLILSSNKLHMLKERSLAGFVFTKTDECIFSLGQLK